MYWRQHARVPDADTRFPHADAGTSRLVVESPVVAALPDAIEVMREPAGGSPTPAGPVVVAWER